MTGPALPSHRRAPPSAPSQSPDRKDIAAASEPRSVADAWRRKLRLHGERSESLPQQHQQHQQPPASEPSPPRRKLPSFIKTLFKPEHRAPAPPPACPAPLLSVHDPTSNQTSSEELKARAAPAMPSSAARWKEPHGAAVVTVGGRRVPFTLDTHRRLRKRRSLASIAETQPTQSSAEAYRRRAYYPAQSARSSSSKREKAAKKP